MNKTILIIDDSAAMRRVLKFNMKNIQGIANQLEAENGKEAFDVLKNNYVDIIVLDINMPVMDGFEFLKKIKSDNNLKKIPIVVVTTEGEDDVRKKVFDLGAAEYLTKPFQSMEFKHVLDNIFGE